MSIYSIRDLEKLTGIKAHTIRIWEQRYRLITPSRTETNIRYYTHDNLRLLLNIALLNRNGMKISKLAKLKPEEITAQGAVLSQEAAGISNRIEALSLAMIDLDEMAFEQVFASEIQESGFEQTMVKLFYPFLEKLRLMWLTGTINSMQEKFIIQLIRRKILRAIDELGGKHGKYGGEKILLYSPEDESQELALLFMQYLVRSRNLHEVYLGTNISINELQDACQIIRPHYVMTILQEPITNQSIQSYVNQVANCVSEGRLMLSGAQLFISSIQLPENTTVLNGLDDTRQFLDALKLRHK
jgi:DNA-binding transcriptional MerR regulator